MESLKLLLVVTAVNTSKNRFICFGNVFNLYGDKLYFDERPKSSRKDLYDMREEVEKLKTMNMELV